MATSKFKDVSPYKKPTPTPPVEDYLNTDYIEDLQANTRVHNVINVAIFGIGRAGTIHLSNLVQNRRVKILYAVEDNVARHKSIQTYWGLHETKFISSTQSDQVFNDKNVTAIIVTSPTFTHENFVRKGLAAKKAVFCEKPISENAAATKLCFEEATKVGKPLFCGFNRRFDPSYAAVQNRVRNGDVGFVQIVKVCSRDSPLPSAEYLKTSGGIFHDCAVHDIDILCWVLGEYPVSVCSISTANIPEIKAMDDFDTVSITMKFASGSVGIIDLSRNSCYGYDQRLEVFGERGMIRADNEQPIHCVNRQIGHTGVTSAPIWFSFPSRYRNAYKREMEHFFDLVDGKTETAIQGSETLAVNRIADAAEESARTGKVINLTWDPKEFPPR